MPRHAFYRFFVGDYLRDAGHLSLLEHGAYRRLIDLYMVEGKPIEFDLPRIYRLLHATSKEEQQAVQTVIEEFFTMDGLGVGKLRHRRCDREIEWQDALSEAAKQAVQRRETYKKQRNANERSSNDNRQIIGRSTSQSQSQSQIKEKEQHPPDVAANPSEEMWSFGVEMLTRDGKQPLTNAAARSFIGSLRKTWPDETVLDALRAATGTNEPRAYARKVLSDKPKRGVIAEEDRYD